MKTLATASIALAATLALTVGASTGPTASAAPTPSAPRSCFWVRDVNNFAAADDENVYIRVGVKEVYQLTLFSHCFNVDWVHHLGLFSHVSSNICEGTNPDLYVVTHDIGIGRQRCPVTSIRKLTPAEVAALPKLARP